MHEPCVDFTFSYNLGALISFKYHYEVAPLKSSVFTCQAPSVLSEKVGTWVIPAGMSGTMDRLSVLLKRALAPVSNCLAKYAGVEMQRLH